MKSEERYFIYCINYYVFLAGLQFVFILLLNFPVSCVHFVRKLIKRLFAMYLLVSFSWKQFSLFFLLVSCNHVTLAVLCRFLILHVILINTVLYRRNLAFYDNHFAHSVDLFVFIDLYSSSFFLFSLADCQMNS